jgi:hypothetical protein
MPAFAPLDPDLSTILSAIFTMAAAKHLFLHAVVVAFLLANPLQAQTPVVVGLGSWLDVKSARFHVG